jgi:septum formation inhibitor MinC
MVIASSAASRSGTGPVKVKISGMPTPTVSSSHTLMDTATVRSGVAVVNVDSSVTVLPSSPLASTVSV